MSRSTPNYLPRLRAALADRYRLEREIGRGGMATVYLAHDLKHDRDVALKLLRPELTTEDGAERFQREITIAARVQHPHILPVHDSGAVRVPESSPGAQDELSFYWYTMPFVEGESLRARLTREPQLPVADALRFTRQAAEALEAAHRQGVIHRDIKPENLLITRDGDILIADFGIARSLTATGQRLTGTGMSVGTPSYMSPEQSAADPNVDARTDIYSLGVALYEMLAGEPPFTGPTAQAIIAKRLSGPAPSIRIVRASVPAAVDQAIRKALQMVPADRFATMADFRAALDPAAVVTDEAGRRPQRWLPMAAAILLLSAGAAFLLRSRNGATPDNALPTSAAVLPFADQSPAHDQAYFSDGLAEELTTVLARIPGLRVAARSSAFQFRGANVNVRDVGRQLDVGAVLEGSVQRDGSRLRVSAQLVDARSGYELWSEIYDRELADVFKVQEEIARAIGTALKIRLAGGTDTALRQRPTQDLEAYDLYLKGRFAWNQRTETSLPEAARFFEQAVARDSQMSRAWAGIADSYVLLPVYAGVAPATAWPRAKAAALRAIALDSSSAEAWTSLAYGTGLYDWDRAAAERAFRRAIAADSSYATAHHWYGDFLAGRGRMEEALAQMLLAQRLDPLSRIIATEVGWAQMSLHRLDDADSTMARLLRLDPNYSQSLFIVAMLRTEQKRYPEAIAAMQRSLELGGGWAHGRGALAAMYARAGDRARATAILDSLTAGSPQGYVPPFVLVLGYANLGDFDRAYREIERGFREKDALLSENFFEPLLDPLKRDPRYARVAARLRGE